MRILVLFIFLFVSQVLHCNAQEVPFRKFGLDNGLPSNRVYSFTQDRDGYIWVATEGGVVKYNGYSFKVFTTRDGLPSSDVWKVQEDQYGRKWLHCYANELGYIKDDVYHKINYKFTKLFKPGNMVEVDDKMAMSYYKDERFRLILIDKYDNVIEVKSLDKYSLKLLMPDKYMYLDMDGVNRMVRMQYRNGSFVFIDSLCKNHFNGLHTRAEGVMNDMLISYRNNTTFFSLYNLKTCENTDRSLEEYGGKKNEEISVMHVFPDSMYIFSNKAIYDFNKKAEFVRRTVHFEQFGDTPLVVSRYKDAAGNMWYGTLDGGGTMIPYKQMLLNKNKTVEGGENLLFRNNIKGNVLYWYQRKLGKPVFMQNGIESKISFPSPSQFVFANAIDDKNWVLLYINSLYRYNTATKAITDMLRNKTIVFDSLYGVQYLKIAKHLAGSTTRFVIADSLKSQVFSGARSVVALDTNRFLMMSSDRVHELLFTGDTVVLSDIHQGRFLSYYKIDKLGLSIHYNSKNFVLADYKSGKYYKYDESFLNRIGIKDIINIASDRYNNLYLHTRNKLYCFNIATFATEEIDMPFQLAEAQFSIYKDYLFVIGPAGIAFRKINGPSSFGELKAIPQLTNAFYNQVYDFNIDDKGLVYINTDKGMYTDTVERLLNSDAAIKVREGSFMKLLLMEPFVRNVRSNDTLILNGDVTSVQFDFINLYGKGQLQYVYTIDNKKTASNTSGELFFPDMEPERYYQVKVRVTDFIWESKEYSFYIYKEPYWWQAQRNVRVFWVAGILGFILFVYAIIIITRHYTYQASEKRSRLLDLELRALYSQINPHFIFNTLSSALFFIDKKKFDEAYTHVSKFSKLLRSYLNSSQERFITLSEEISMLRNYIELQQTRFEERFDFDIVVENKIPADNVKIPSLLLQPLIENAINHGLFHKQGKGTLIISFVQGASSDELICIIEDDGVGRQRAAEIKQQNTVQYKSYGTKLTRRLIHIFNEYEDMNISMEYIDKHEPDTGTIVKLTIRNLKYEA